MKESIFGRGEKGPSISKRVKEVTNQPETVGDPQSLERARMESKSEVYPAVAHIIKDVHQGVIESLENGSAKEAINHLFVHNCLPYELRADSEGDTELAFVPPADMDEFNREQIITVLTRGQDLYADVFWYVINRPGQYFQEKTKQIYKGLQSIIEAAGYRGMASNNIENFIMGGVNNASSEVWGAYMALAYQHQKQFGEPMQPEDFQAIEKDLTQVFLKLSTLQFDTLLALMLAQKQERKVSVTIAQYDSEAEVERFRRMLQLHKQDDKLHVDLDIEYLESFNNNLRAFPPQGEKRYGCPARYVTVTDSENVTRGVISDLVHFYGKVASLTFPLMARQLEEAIDFYTHNKENFLNGEFE